MAFVCYNFNVDFHLDADAEGRLDWRTSNPYYPFVRGVYFDKVHNAGKIGFYVKLFEINLSLIKKCHFMMHLMCTVFMCIHFILIVIAVEVIFSLLS